MANVSNSASNTIVSLLGTVNNTASAVSKTINAVTQSVDMLDLYIATAKETQRERYALEALDRRENLINQLAEAQEEREEQLNKKYAGAPQRAQRFESIRQRYLAALEPENKA